MRRCYVLIGLLGLTMVAAGAAAEYYVSPAGADANPGTEAKPFATLGRARDAVRAAGKLGKEPVTVHILSGVQYLPETLVFTPADSGTAAAPVVYLGEPGGEVVVSGGLKLNLQWEPYKEGIRQAKVPAGLAIDQVFINGERQHMARYPNYEPDQRIMHGYAADAFSKERVARWADPAGGYIHAMHSAEWGDVHFLITGKKPDGSLSYEGGWQNNRGAAMHPVQRFVENIFEELDAPGEWFLNAQTGRLYCYPPAGVDLSKAVIEVVRLRHLIELKGEPSKPVKFITLRGLTFRHATRTFMENREPLNRSDWTTYRGGAVFVNGTEDCQLADCSFDQVGGNSVFVNDYNRRFAVRGCLIRASGANGVAFVGDASAVRSPLANYNQAFDYGKVDRTPGPLTQNYPADCLVEDCLITRTGWFERQTAGVQISISMGIRVRHCSIYDVPRAGINMSEGCWGGHLIEFCDVFDTVKETGDHGSFNSWGRDRYWHPDVNVINREVAAQPDFPKLDMLKPNFLRNNRWRCDHGWDIDLDDGSSYYQIYNNLCLNGGIKNREGYHRTVTNNIMVNNTFHPHVWLAKSGDVFKHNIVMGAYRPAIMPSGKWGQEVDYNFFTTGEGDRTRFAANGCDAHSLSGDPMFVDPAAGNYQVREDSPALKVGFRNFPMHQFGVQKPALKAIAKTPELPRVKAGSLATARWRAERPHYFCQARVRDIQGLGDRSAYGLPDESGVLVLQVPTDSPLARGGITKDDVIVACNDTPVRTVAGLLDLQEAAHGAPLKLSAIRKQQRINAEVSDYAVVAVEPAWQADGFKMVRLATSAVLLPLKIAGTRPGTKNEPPPVLVDGKLDANYGPVFENQVSSGCYKADLGEVNNVGAVDTFSYNQNNNRGRQSFVLYGSAATTDPGWNVTDSNVFIPIAMVDTPADASVVYVATRVSGNSGKPLGSYRWLVWSVYPVTDHVENTAFQEFQVLTASASSASPLQQAAAKPGLPVINVRAESPTYLYGGQASMLEGDIKKQGGDNFSWKGGGRLTWEVRVDRAGEYEVSLCHAAEPGAVGRELQINSGNSRISYKLLMTKGLFPGNMAYEMVPIKGSLELAAGTQFLTLSVTDASQGRPVLAFRSLELIPVAAKAAIEVGKQEARRARAGTAWLAKAGYGLMFHWTSQSIGKDGTHKPYAQAVDDFDLDCFVEMVEATGAGYVLFTVGHVEPYCPAPLKSWEQYHPGKTTRRDLIMEMAEALKAKGIKLMCYFPAHVVGKYPKADEAEFSRIMSDVMTEFGDRYREKVAGYWFDGCYQCYEKYPDFSFRHFFKVCKTGNPNRIIALNSWIYPNVSEWQEYWAGETASPVALPVNGTNARGPGEGLRYQALLIMEPYWVQEQVEMPAPRFNAQQLGDYISQCMKKGGAVTINLGIYQDGSVDPRALDVFKEARQRIRKTLEQAEVDTSAHGQF